MLDSDASAPGYVQRHPVTGVAGTRERQAPEQRDLSAVNLHMCAFVVGKKADNEVGAISTQ
jgi:hypothetical protein